MDSMDRLYVWMVAIVAVVICAFFYAVNVDAANRREAVAKCVAATQKPIECNASIK